jgi:S-adenosylmethionine hydrolase
VVDPGVGSARRPLALTSGGQGFVGPRQRLFTFALADSRLDAVALEAPHGTGCPRCLAPFMGGTSSRTAAAHGRAACRWPTIGHPARDLVLEPLPAARREGLGLLGEVLAADRFGNHDHLDHGGPAGGQRAG